MRPRPLQEDSPIIRKTGYADLSVTAGTVFKTAMETPATYGLVKQAWQTSGSVFESLTEEERETAREQQRQRKLRQSSLEAQLDTETDAGKREQILSEISSLYQQEETQRDDQVQTMIEDGRLLSVDALTEEYGDLLTFDAPMTREKADLLYKNKRESRVRDAIISKGLDDVPGYAALIGGSLVAAATDPVELAAAFIPVTGVAGRAAAVARFGRVGGAVAVGTAEGFAGALLTEPLYYGLSQQQQLDYSMGEALLNVGIGTLLGSGIGTVRGIYDVRKPNIKEITQDVETVTDVLPEPVRVSDEEALRMAEKTKQNILKNYNVLGGHNVANTVLRQFVTDHAIDVTPVMPKTMPKPMDLGQFVREQGGINDADRTFRGELSSFDVRGVRGYYNNKGTYVSRISNPDGVSLDEMADVAYQAGYLTKRDPNELVEKLRDTSAGNYHFAAQDQGLAADWRATAKAQDDFEAEMATRANIREQVKQTTGRTLSDEEVAIISDRMARTGDEIEVAAEDVQLKLYEAEAEYLSRYMSSPRADVASDVDAAQRFADEAAAIQDEFSFDAELQQSDAIIRQYQEAGDLTDDDIRAIAELQQVEETMDAYIELVQTAAICTARA